jgi:hypothetical protein
MAGTGSEWGGRSSTDTIRKELRVQANDQRASADIRVDAVRRLMCLEGFLPIVELGDGAQDLLIRQIVEPTQKEIAPEAKPLSAIEAALKRYEASKGER